MFREPFNFSLQRSPREAAGFYIVHVALLMVVAMFAGVILGVPFSALIGSDKPDISYMIGIALSLCYCSCLCVMLLRQKHLRSLPLMLGGLLLTAILSLGGAIFGMLPVAYLSTRPANPESNNEA